MIFLQLVESLRQNQYFSLSLFLLFGQLILYGFLAAYLQCEIFDPVPQFFSQLYFTVAIQRHVGMYSFWVIFYLVQFFNEDLISMTQLIVLD